MSIFRSGMSKTRQSFFGRISQMLTGSAEIDDDTWDDIEALLIQADMGVDTTRAVLEDLQNRVRKQGVRRAEDVQPLLKQSLRALLKRPASAEHQRTPPFYYADRWRERLWQNYIYRQTGLPPE